MIGSSPLRPRSPSPSAHARPCTSASPSCRDGPRSRRRRPATAVARRRVGRQVNGEGRRERGSSRSPHFAKPRTQLASSGSTAAPTRAGGNVSTHCIESPLGHHDASAFLPARANVVIRQGMIGIGHVSLQRPYREPAVLREPLEIEVAILIAVLRVIVVRLHCVSSVVHPLSRWPARLLVWRRRSHVHRADRARPRVDSSASASVRVSFPP